MPAYKRILLKLSGEALMGDDAFGINRATIVRMVEEIAEVTRLGVEVAVVIGGASYLLVSYFRRLNARKEAESVDAKKAADLRYLAAGGPGAPGSGYASADGAAGASDDGEGSLKKSLLRG